MDMQIKDRQKERKEAAIKLGCEVQYLEYFAWPQQFGSTTGPFGGIGGQAISTFTLEAWSDGRNAAIFCNGRFVKVIERFEFNTNVRL